MYQQSSISISLSKGYHKMNSKTQYQKTVALLVLSVVAGALLILIGWYADIDFLRHPLPTILPTPPITAWLLLGTSGILYGRILQKKITLSEDAQKIALGKRLMSVLNGASWCLIIINLLLLAMTLWAIIDRSTYLAPHPIHSIQTFLYQEQTDGIISLRSALSMILLGIALLFTPPQNARHTQAFGFAALGSLLIALMSLLGYVYSASAMYMMPTQLPIGMAFPTALMIAALSIGILLLNITDIPFMVLFFRHETTALLTRQRVILTSGFALVLGGFALVAVENHIMDTATAIGAMVFILIVGLSWMLITTGVAALRWEEERETAMKELQVTEAELRKTIATRDRLYSVIAHDLRSPFATISASAYMLREEVEQKNSPEINEDMKMSIHGIDSASQQLSALLDNLLEWTRAQRGKISISPSVINIFSLVESIIPVYEPTFAKKGISFDSDISEELYVLADRNMLHTVLRNLISNAIKFTPTGGQITVGARKYSTNMTTIALTDTGIGMSEEVRRKLFDNSGFTTYGTSGEKGTGLGLGLCKDFIELNNGQIRVQSVLGKGSTFLIYLPSSDAQSSLQPHHHSFQSIIDG
jgi:signal transduction histidine kinase